MCGGAHLCGPQWDVLDKERRGRRTFSWELTEDERSLICALLAREAHLSDEFAGAGGPAEAEMHRKAAAARTLVGKLQVVTP